MFVCVYVLFVILHTYKDTFSCTCVDILSGCVKDMCRCKKNIHTAISVHLITWVCMCVCVCENDLHSVLPETHKHTYTQHKSLILIHILNFCDGKGKEKKSVKRKGGDGVKTLPHIFLLIWCEYWLSFYTCEYIFFVSWVAHQYVHRAPRWT